MTRGGTIKLIFLSSLLLFVVGLPKTYLNDRNDVLSAEANQRTGGKLQLNDDEMKANRMLMQMKRREIESSINGSIFAPAVNFMLTKANYEESKVFKIIRKMPKGASLHLHEFSVPSLDWIVKNLTYRPDCYMCVNSEGTLLFHFYRQKPVDSDIASNASDWLFHGDDPSFVAFFQHPHGMFRRCASASFDNIADCKWGLVSDMRQRSGNVTAFDARIYDSMTLKNQESLYISNHDIWKKFWKTFETLGGLLNFTGVTKDRMGEVLKQAQDDNLMYLEIRQLSPAYDIDGGTRNRDWVLNAYKDVVADFQKSCPDFIGVKYIISGFRSSSNTVMRSIVNETIRLMQKYPTDIAGFDLAFDENAGRPIFDFVDDLLYPATLSPPVDLPYFLHAGETDWLGTEVNNNILDAILVGTKRIGHGIAFHGHPEFLRLLKERNIAVEVNPISNQVLKLVPDLRVHPAVTLLAEDYPVVISSDSPNSWGALPASHDYYAAFMALGGAAADLRFLKQLCINSIIYSAMSDEEKIRALHLWNKRWDDFIINMVETTE